jgi:hypothetical protein
MDMLHSAHLLAPVQPVVEVPHPDDMVVAHQGVVVVNATQVCCRLQRHSQLFKCSNSWVGRLVTAQIHCHLLCGTT